MCQLVLRPARLFHARSCLLAVGATAARTDHGGVGILKDIESALERAHEQVDVLRIVQLNRDFHAAIADMTGNPFMMGWMKTLLDQGQRVFRLYLASFGDRVPLPKLSQHHAMIQAIERGDAAAAERAGKADAQGLIRRWCALATAASADLDLGGVAVRAVAARGLSVTALRSRRRLRTRLVCGRSMTSARPACRPPVPCP
jgi:DNA-binding FadR family transcriptional regulator